MLLKLPDFAQEPFAAYRAVSCTWQ